MGQTQELASGDFVAFEGPIGVGKTTLAELIGARLNARRLLERPEFNEYLADFYQDSTRYALPMQLSFLLDRAEQLRASFPVKPNDCLVADYTLAKDKLFADLLLQGRDLRLYDKARDALSLGVPEPRLLVYLDAEASVLLERIRRRNRDYETSITADYLERLREAYDAHVSKLDQGRVVRIDSAKIDITDELQLDELARRLRR